MTYLYGKNSVLSTDGSKKLDRMEEGIPQPLGGLPRGYHTNFNTAPINIKKMNRYLGFMNKRINKYILCDKSKAAIIGLIMLRMSLSYQLVLLHKSKSDGYWSVSEENVIKEFQKLRNRLRSGELKMEVTRYYIEKKPEQNLPDYLKKGRPIGAPGGTGKAIGKCITDMVAHLTQDIQPPFQHAYRYNKGIGSAVLEIIENINKGYIYILEFDLKGFFNNVRYQDIMEELAKVTPILSAVVLNAIAKIHYSFTKYNIKEIGTAKEKFNRNLFYDAITTQWKDYNLKFFNHKRKGYEPQLMAEDELILDPTKPMTIARSGMPQGMGFSAIVATYCNPLNKFVNKFMKMVLFSDDGIIMFKTERDREKTHIDLRSGYQRGVLISGTKTRKVADQFNFLGLLIDVKHRIIFFNKGAKIGGKTPVISFDDPKLKIGLDKIVTLYMKQPKKGTGLVKRDSFAMRAKFKMDIKTRICTLTNGILFGKSYKNLRAFYVYGLYGKILDISKTSTYCMDILASRVKNRRYKKLKNLKLNDISYNLNSPTLMKKKGTMNGSIYKDYLYDKTQVIDANYDKMVQLSSNLENLREGQMDFVKGCKFMNDPRNSSAVETFKEARKNWKDDIEGRDKDIHF